MEFHNRRLFNNAIERGNLEEAASLLENGGLLRTDFYNYLSRSVEENDLTKLRLLLDHEMQHNRSLHLIYLLDNKGFGRPMIEAILPHCTFVTPRDRRLIYAFVENGYLPIVEDRLNRGIDFNMVNPKTKFNLLTIACLNKHHQVVELLLQHGAYTNSRISSEHEIINNHECVGPNLRTYLDIFPSNYHMKSVFDNYYSYRKGELKFNITPLHIAVFNTDWMTTEVLLRYGARIADRNELFNLACIAAKNGCTEIVGGFLSIGLSLRCTESLLNFCVHKNPDKKDYGYNIAKLLLEGGEDIHIKTPIIYLAIINKHYKTARLFLDYAKYICPDGNTLLHRAIEYDFDEEFIKTLLELSLSVDSRNVNMLTPLHVACKSKSNNKLPVIKTLLQYNANPNAVDDQRRTPLHYICDCGGDIALDIIQLLLERGANVDAMDINGRSPLFSACQAADEGIIKFLLDNRANSRHVDLKNLTLLNIVLKNYKWNFETVNILLKNNVKVHNIDNKGRSIAHYVAETNDDRFITIFAAMGVNFNSVDDEGNTPLHVAVEKSCVKMTRYLIKYGVDINISNKNGKTPLQEASEMIHSTDTPITGMYRLEWKKKIVAELTEQVVILKVAGLKVSEQNLDIVYDSKDGKLSPRRGLHTLSYITFDVRELGVKCEKEIQMMKTESTGVDDLTFCDLLKRHIYPSSKVVENEEMKNILELEVYNKKYPLYINIIRNRFQEATTLQKINKMRDSAKKYFNLHISQQLPEECIDMILDYLDKEELNMLAEDVESFYDQLALSEENQKTWLGYVRKIKKFFY